MPRTSSRWPTGCPYDGEFVGFDLAAHPIEHGKRFARTLGLKNVTLTTLDLADFPPAAGRFDYIVAHGLYSCVSRPRRAIASSSW